MHPAHFHTCPSLSSSFLQRTHREMLFHRNYSLFSAKRRIQKGNKGSTCLPQQILKQ